MKYLISTAVVLDIDEDELVGVVQRMEENVREQLMAGVVKAALENDRTLVELSTALSEITDEEREEIEQKVQFFGVFVAPSKDLLGMIVG